MSTNMKTAQKSTKKLVVPKTQILRKAPKAPKVPRVIDGVLVMCMRDLVYNDKIRNDNLIHYTGQRGVLTWDHHIIENPHWLKLRVLCEKSWKMYDVVYVENIPRAYKTAPIFILRITGECPVIYEPTELQKELLEPKWLNLLKYGMHPVKRNGELYNIRDGSRGSFKLCANICNNLPNIAHHIDNAHYATKIVINDKIVKKLRECHPDIFRNLLENSV